MATTEPLGRLGALTLENQSLKTELSARLAELRSCRAQAVQTAEATRRRIERNLHDGAQQRLVSLALSLGLLDAKLPTDPDAAKPIVREVREALAVALKELRELSQGLCPSVLTERGLEGALKDLCHRAPLPARLDIRLDSRPPADAEAAAYFVISEAITNAAKHACAREARVAVFYAGQLLVVEVADDGIGRAAPHRGSGLRGLAERVEALGGRLTISSPPGRGTTVCAEIPLRADAGHDPQASIGVIRARQDRRDRVLRVA